jgi:hypothetical protein
MELDELLEEQPDPRDTDPNIAIEWDGWVLEKLLLNLPDWAKVELPDWAK